MTHIYFDTCPASCLEEIGRFAEAAGLESKVKGLPVWEYPSFAYPKNYAGLLVLDYMPKGPYPLHAEITPAGEKDRDVLLLLKEIREMTGSKNVYKCHTKERYTKIIP